MRGCNRIQTSDSYNRKEIISVGRIGGGKSQSKTVYSPEGICPTICAALDKGNTMPYIIEISISEKNDG